MVKGLSRRIVLVKSPDPALFEEAIFIVREDCLAKGITQEALLREARSVADAYFQEHVTKSRFPRIPAPAYAAMGAGAASLSLLLLYYLI